MTQQNLPNTKLIDRFNRRLNYLRISITDRCNLRCIYCTPRKLIPKLSHDDILKYEEILHIAKIGADLGISKIRITGGEPLVRRGVYDFLGKITKISGLKDIAITTNGVFLKENIQKIKSAGIKRINVSLDTLNKEKFKKITGLDLFSQVWEGIKAAQKQGLNPVKINVVVLRGINDDELIQLAGLSFSYPFHIRFIEYMPVGKTVLKIKQHIFAPEIKERISILGDLIPIKTKADDGPAERFKFKNAKGEIGFIHPLSNHFCHTCNRLRLTASGQLRPCLLSNYQKDIKIPLRCGCSDMELADLFLEAAYHKPHGHNLAINHYGRVTSEMCSIGG